MNVIATVTFSGTVSAQAASGETVTLTITKPDNTTETLTATTLADKSFSATKQYDIAGSYKATAHGDADAIYTAWDTAEMPFTITLTLRTGTLNVQMA